MKKLLGVLVLALVVPRVGAAGEGSFGIRGGIAVPNGTFQDPSVYVDMVKTIKSKGDISMAFGATCANFKDWDDSIMRIAGFFGSQILVPLSSTERTTALYFLPAISAGPTFRVSSGSDKTWRWGIDLGTGLMIPIGSANQKFEIGIVYSLTNALKKRKIEDYYDEPSLNLLNIHIGLDPTLVLPLR